MNALSHSLSIKDPDPQTQHGATPHDTMHAMLMTRLCSAFEGVKTGYVPISAQNLNAKPAGMECALQFAVGPSGPRRDGVSTTAALCCV